MNSTSRPGGFYFRPHFPSGSEFTWEFFRNRSAYGKLGAKLAVESIAYREIPAPAEVAN
jgi:hypothetical protein